MLITIEGPEAVGKTTQINRLKKRFPNAIYSKEPGSDAPGGKELRSLLLGGGLGNDAALLCFLADRAQHMEFVVKPALEKGLDVIVDRGYLSTIAYDLAARGFGDPVDEMRHLDKILPMLDFAQVVAPDLTIIMSGPIAKADQVMHARGGVDKIEARGLNFHKKIHNIFQELGREESVINRHIKNTMKNKSKNIISVLPSFVNSEDAVFQHIEKKISELI